MNQNSNKFKLVLTGIFGFFILFGLIAFSTYKSSSPTSNDVEVKVWGTVDKIVFDSYIERYKQEKAVNFKLAYTYKNINTIDKELVEAIATGKAPDAILIPQNLIKRYLDKVFLIPPTSLSERVFKDLFVQESELYLQPEGIFGLPFFIDPFVMYWNRDMFSSAGIAVAPTKWSAFPSLAEKISLSDKNGNITRSAVALGEYKNIDNAKALISTLFLQAGSPIVSLSGGILKSQLQYKTDSNINFPSDAALLFYTDYSNPKKVSYSWNRSLPSSKNFFLSENLATYFGFASEYTDIKEKNPNLNFDVAVIPQIIDAKKLTTYGELYGFAMLKNSQNLTQTFSLLSLLVGADSVSSFLQFMDVAPARRDLIALGSQDSAKSVFFNSALISQGWIDPDAEKTNKIFQDMIDNITTGKANIRDSVSRADIEIDVLLQ